MGSGSGTAGAAAAGPAVGKNPLIQPVTPEVEAVPAKPADSAAGPAKETPWNAKLETSADQLLQAFDDGGWNLDVLTAKIAIGLKSSPAAYVEVLGNWQPDVKQGSSVELKAKAEARATTVRQGLQQWGAFPEARLRSHAHGVSIDGGAPAGSFRATEVWFRTGGAALAPVVPPPGGDAGSGLAGVPGPGGPVVAGKQKLPAAPAATTQRIKDLGDLIAAAGDAVTKDKLVKELRDLIVQIQPFISDDADMRKKLDDAIVSGVGAGIKAALQAMVEKLAGKSATEVSADQPSHVGPDVAPVDLKEKILKTPELPLPFDKPAEVKHARFDFRGLAASYPPGASIDVTLVTPDDFAPTGAGAGRVVLLAQDDYLAHGGLHADAVAQQAITAKGTVKLSLAAPMKEASYVLAVRVGMELREVSEKFKIAKP